MFPFDDDGELEPLPPIHDSRWLLTCAAVGMRPSHAELGVLVDDTVVRRLVWSGANESDDYVRQNYNN